MKAHLWQRVRYMATCEIHGNVNHLAHAITSLARSDKSARAVMLTAMKMIAMKNLMAIIEDCEEKESGAEKGGEA